MITGVREGTDTKDLAGQLRNVESRVEALEREKAELQRLGLVQQERLVDLSVRVSEEIVMLHSLLEFSKTASASLDKKELLGRSLELLQRAFGFGQICLFSTAPDGRYLRLEDSSIRALGSVKGLKLSLKNSFLESTVLSGQTRLIEGLDKLHDSFCGSYAPDMECALCSPLLLRGQLRGVIVAFGQSSATFSDRHTHVLEAAGGHLAIAIENCDLHERIQRQAMTDPLTGLPNRRVLNERLGAEISRAHRHSRPLSVLMVDIDHFKRFNDTFGHQMGDTVLQMVASLLTCQMRHEDMCARYGGEEFVAVLPEAGSEDAVQSAERLRSEAEKLLIQTLDSGEEHLTISVGVATLRDGSLDADQLIGQADRAMYEAKRRGRNLVQVYEECEAAAHGQ